MKRSTLAFGNTAAWRQAIRRAGLIIPGVLISIGISACGTGKTQPVATATPGGEYRSQEIIGLPQPSALRSASATAVQRIVAGSGNKPGLASNHVTAEGSSAVFTPAIGPPGSTAAANAAYAIYELSIPTDLPPVALNFHWNTSPDAGTAWVGLASFTANRWEWFELAADAKLSLPVWTSYRNASNVSYVAMMVMAGPAAELGWIRAGDNAPPVVNVEILGASGRAPQSVLFNAEATIDLDSGIASYEWDYTGDGTYEVNEADADSASWTYYLGGTLQARLRVTDTEGAATVQDLHFALDEHADWWCWGKDRKQSRRATVNGPQTEPANPTWKYDVGERIGNLVLIGADGAIYFADEGGIGHCLEPDGSLRWSRPDGGVSIIGPGDVLYGDYSNGALTHMTAVHAADLSPVFDVPLISARKIVGFGLDGTLLVFEPASKVLYGLDRLNPSSAPRWSAQLQYGNCSAASIGDDGSIYIFNYLTSSASKLLAFSMDGTFHWEVVNAYSKTSAVFPIAPLIGSDGSIYALVGSGGLNSIDPATGLLRWPFAPKRLGGELGIALAGDLGEDRVICADQNGLTYSYRPDGSLRWSFDCEGGADNETYSPLSGADGKVYFTYGNYGDMFCVRPNRNLQWSAPCDWPEHGSLTNKAFMSALAADGTLFVRHRDMEGLLAYKD